MKLVSPKLVENCKCVPVTDFGKIEKLADQMFHIMTTFRGVGLAAPQVGIFERFFIIENFQGPGYELFINPEIPFRCKHMGTFKEGCLTYNTPSSKPTWVVKRPKSIEAKWQKLDGNWETRRMSKVTAEVFLHEFDHLDGITIKNKGSL